MDNLKVREEVDWFAVRMEKKLRENDHKGGWSECSEIYLKKRCRDEIIEVFQKVGDIGVQIFFGGVPNADSIEELIDECADVANFAMMLADKARKHIQESGYEE